MIVDAYTHCGQEKFRPLEEVREMMLAAEISKAVLAQHLGQYDNSYIDSCVRSDPTSLVGVAMIDAPSVGSLEALDEVVASGSFGGLRMTAQMLVEAPSIASMAMEAGLHLVLYCPDGVDAIEEVLPGLASGPGRIVVTHLGSPVVEDGQVTRGEEVLRLASDPRVMVTLSGAGMACAPPHQPLGPLVRQIVERFGPERVMWASNFPVTGDAQEVRADLELLLANVWNVPASSIDLIAGEVAAHTWFGDRDLT